MTIVAVGSTPASTSGTGAGTTSTQAVTPTATQNILVACSLLNNTARTATVSGGGCTDWARVGTVYNDTFYLCDWEIWFGRIITPGAATITWTWNGSVASTNLGLWVQEFASTVPCTWAGDVSAGRTNTSSTTVTYPTVAPTSGTAELYVGVMYHDNPGTAGSTAGFTYKPNLAAGSMVYNPAVVASSAPTMTQSPTATSAGIAALITATPLATPPQPYTARRRAANF